MKIHGYQLDKHLKGAPQPLYWVTGDETLLVQQSTDKLRCHLRELQYEEREIWHADSSTNWQALLLSANNLSLFASRKRVEVRFSTGKPGEKALTALAEYLEAPNPDCVLLLSGPKIDASASRSKAFKRVESKSLVVQIWPIDNHKLPDWIGTQLQQAGFRADREALRLLSERVEGNLLAARQEVDKLVLTVEPGTVIDTETVARSVANSARYSVFDLSEPLLLGDARSALRILHGLREEGSDTATILWSLSRDLRRLLTIRQAIDSGQRAETAMEQTGIWKKQQRPFKSAVARLTVTQLYEAQACAREADLSIKGLSSIDPWLALETLILNLSGHSTLSANAHQAG